MYEFEYQRPDSLAKARELATEDSRYLAGGQSLVQSMKLRLASADKLIDLSGISGLDKIDVSGDTVSIGAMARHHGVASSAPVQKAIGALAHMASGIGDQMVRNMGTLGGAIANADPAACYPAAVLALNATITTDQREIAGDDFFKGLFETALEPGELIKSVQFKVPQRAAYVKFKQPASRFALVGVMVAQFDDGVRVGVTGAQACAYREAAFEKALNGKFDASVLEPLTVSDKDMNADLHGSADYRAAMVKVMASRAVEQAAG